MALQLRTPGECLNVLTLVLALVSLAPSSLPGPGLWGVMTAQRHSVRHTAQVRVGCSPGQSWVPGELPEKDPGSILTLLAPSASWGQPQDEWNGSGSPAVFWETCMKGQMTSVTPSLSGKAIQTVP